MEVIAAAKKLKSTILEGRNTVGVMHVLEKHREIKKLTGDARRDLAKATLNELEHFKLTVPQHLVAHLKQVAS